MEHENMSIKIKAAHKSSKLNIIYIEFFLVFYKLVWLQMG